MPSLIRSIRTRHKSTKQVRKLLTLLFLAAFLATSMGIFRVAHACSCAAAFTPEQAFQKSDAVFTGTVTSISPPIGIIPNSASPEEVAFRVSNVSKGPPPSADGTIVLKTAVSDASCGYPFQNGGQYLVYAYNSGQQLQTDLCSGTMLLSTVPLSTAQGGIPAAGLLPNLYYIMILASAIAVSAALLLYSKRRNKSGPAIGAHRV
jgi:hypothetical protein